MQTPKRIFLTGGTGFLGSHIAAELLRQGYFINFLARSNAQFHAEERILRALCRLTALNKSQYRVFDGDVTSPIQPKIDMGKIDEVWHCAASLSFKEEDRIETLATNVTGTKNILDFMSRLGIETIHNLGTAYQIGEQRGLIKEDDIGVKFYNPYEESKALEEKLILDWSFLTRGKYFMYRPSVVVGHSKTGFTTSFTGYYTVARGFSLLKKLIAADLKRNSHSKYFNSGVTSNGHLTLPIFFPGSPDTMINILPVDVLIKAVMKIADFGMQGTYHLTNATPVKFRWLLAASLYELGIKGVTIGEPPSGTGLNPVLTELNDALKKTVKYYKPYASYGADGPVFDQTNTVKVLGQELKYKITKAYLQTILRYAEHVNYRGQ